MLKNHLRNTHTLAAVSLEGTCWLIVACLAAPLAAAAEQPELNDRTLRNKVEDELLTDRTVDSWKIDVASENGVVTLQGAVDNLLSKERAVWIAETVKGVRAIIDRLDVIPSGIRPDSALADDVRAALLADPATDSYEVTVQVDEGEVVLSGTVDSHQERRLAGTVAKGVDGVRALRNDLYVSYPDSRTDQEIAAEIKQALKWSVLVDAGLIDVRVQDGKVTLLGTVGTAAEKRRAEVTTWVNGVSEVDLQNLKVADWRRDDLKRTSFVKTDDQVREAVKDALAHDPRVNAFQVLVDVNYGTVTLRGVVDNLKAKRSAAEDSRNTVGVARVFNRLKVRSSSEVGDEQLLEQIQQSLERHPLVNRYDVTVTVRDGTAHLYGLVDSYSQKFLADDVASRVNGVSRVRNFLQVNDHRPALYDPHLNDLFPEDYDWYRVQPAATSLPDDLIQADIESELWWSPFVDSDQVKVEVENGVATLSGRVDSWNERRIAAENAYQGGATWVDNDLIVMREMTQN